MSIVNHHDLPRRLHSVIHNDRQFATLLLNVDRFLRKSAVISLHHNDRCLLVRVYFFKDAIFEYSGDAQST